nr:hypothetical protein [uncultured Desulfobacter sp.]
MTDQENVIPTDHKKILVLNTRCMNMEALNGKLDRLKEMAEKRDGQEIRNLMMEMIPEYRPN